MPAPAHRLADFGCVICKEPVLCEGETYFCACREMAITQTELEALEREDIVYLPARWLPFAWREA